MESKLQGVLSTDNATRIKELLDANNDIYNKLHQYKDALKNIHNSSTIAYNDIIDFADNITLTLSAPRLYRDGLPLIASHAPCPQFYEMRMGKLTSFNNSSVVKQIQDMDKKTNDSIDSKISIMHESQISNNNSNKRKRDDSDTSEIIEDRPIRRLKEEAPNNYTKSDVKIETSIRTSNINGTSNTTVITSTTTQATTSSNNNMDISKAETKISESNDNAKIKKTEANPPPPQAPKRVINISFGLSDSDSDDD